jgi:hypothetical protein
VWLSRQRITKEQHSFNTTFCDSTTDNQITTIRSVRNAFDFQTELLLKQFSGVTDHHKIMPTMVRDMLPSELQHIVFLSVVSEDSFAWCLAQASRL